MFFFVPSVWFIRLFMKKYLKLRRFYFLSPKSVFERFFLVLQTISSRCVAIQSIIIYLHFKMCAALSRRSKSVFFCVCSSSSSPTSSSSLNNDTKKQFHTFNTKNHTNFPWPRNRHSRLLIDLIDTKYLWVGLL